jgi:hypothetical protein
MTNGSINVIVDGQCFTFRTALLRCYSDYFMEIMKSDKAAFGNGSTKTNSNIQHTMPSDLEISSLQFTIFLCWVQHGYLIKPLYAIPDDGSDIDLGHLWVVGHRLGSPRFQNYVMERLRSSKKVQAGDWPTPNQARTVYQITSDIQASRSGTSSGKYPMLRKFVAHSIAANSPFDRYDEGSSEYDDWSRLYRKNPDISLDVHKVGGKQWIASKPWDDEHRNEYSVEEWSIDDRWQEISGENRTLEEGARAQGGIRTDLESAHLEREQHTVGGIQNVNDKVGH